MPHFNGAGRLILCMICLSIAVVAGAFVYYTKINRSEDPRILPARKLLATFQKQVKDDQTEAALNSLNAMDEIYKNTPGYSDAFERGVLMNDRATIFLKAGEQALLDAQNAENPMPDITMELTRAEQYLKEAVTIYENWIRRYGEKGPSEIEDLLTPYYVSSDIGLPAEDAHDLMLRRRDALVDAQIETPRRLSVTLTNLAVIARYRGETDTALTYYNTALTLWPDNRTAENNRRVLGGESPVKENIIKQLFPKTRKESLDERTSG